MLRRFLSGAAMVLAASLSLTAAARAALVDFSAHTIYDSTPNAFNEQGLHFDGGQIYFIPPDDPDVVMPDGYTSAFIETYLLPEDSQLLYLTLPDNGAFDLLSLDLGLGDYNSGTLDSVAVTRTKANCSSDCTSTVTLDVGQAFTFFDLSRIGGFSGLASVSFGPQRLGVSGTGDIDGGYLAFDNVSYFVDPVIGGAAPEPSAWAMMIAGFGGIGALMRRKGRRSAVQA